MNNNRNTIIGVLQNWPPATDEIGFKRGRFMKQEKIKKIEAKVKLGLPLTREERAYYILFAKELNVQVMEVLNA